MAKTSLVFRSMDSNALQVISSFFPGRISKDRQLRVMNKILSNDDVAIRWTQEGQNSLDFNSPAQYPFLVIPSYALHEGVGFVLYLNIELESVGIVTVKIQFTVNLGPVHGEFSVTPATGSVSDDFQLKSYGWEDGDGPDLPLTHSIGYLQSSTEAIFIRTQVCDSMLSCTSATRDVEVAKGGRRLANEDFVTKFEQQSSDSRLTVSACVILLQIFDVQQETWTYVLQRVLSYVADQSSVTEQDLLAFISCHEELMRSRSSDANLISVLDSLFTVTAKYSDEINEKLFERLINVFSHYQVADISNVSNLWTYYERIQQMHLDSCLPEQAPYSYAGSQINFHLRKLLASSLSQGLSVHVGNFSVSITSNFTTDASIANTQVVNLVFNQMRFTKLPAGVVGLSLQTAGTFSKLLYTPAAATAATVRSDALLPI